MELMKAHHVLNHIAEPQGYDSLLRWQRYYVRLAACSGYEDGLKLGAGNNQGMAKQLASELAGQYVRKYQFENDAAALAARCGAKTRKGQPCKHKPIAGRKRCKFHGGMSTGAKSLSGRIRALSGLKQYQQRPDLLKARIARLRADYGAPLL